MRIGDVFPQQHAALQKTVTNPPRPLANQTIQVQAGSTVNIRVGANGGPWSVEWTDVNGDTQSGTLNPEEAFNISQPDGTEATVVASNAVPVPSSTTTSTTTTTTTTVATPPPAEGVYVHQSGETATLAGPQSMTLGSGTLPDRPVTLAFSSGTLPDRP